MSARAACSWSWSKGMTSVVQAMAGVDRWRAAWRSVGDLAGDLRGPLLSAVGDQDARLLPAG